MGIESYSTNAADNASNGWAEGMAPSGVNDTGRQMMADSRGGFNSLPWFEYRDGTPQGTFTYVSGTSFKVSGNDCTDRYQEGFRVRAIGSSTGDIIGTIVESTYSAPDTTITVAWDDGALVNEPLIVLLSVVTIRSVPAIPAAAPEMSTGTSGYYELPGGVLVQWGIDTTITHGRTVTFPIPFPNVCWVVVPSVKFVTGTTIDVFVDASTYTTANFKQVAKDASGNTVSSSPYGQFAYIAIGN